MSRILNGLSKNYVLLLIVVFGGFLIFGFSENIKGPALPRMQAELSLDELQVGVLLAFNSLGYLLACSFTGWLARKAGLKLTTALAFVSMALSGVCMFFAANYAALSGAYFLMYIGNGILEIALAILAARIFVKNTGAMMNLAHFFYGLSSTFAPLIAASLMGVQLQGSELGWRGMYMLMLALSVLPLLPGLFARYSGEEESQGERKSLKDFVRDPVAWLIVIVLSFGVVSELAVGGWLVNFLEKAYGWSGDAAARMLSAFFFCFMLARLLLGPVTDKIGYTMSLILLSAFSGLCSIAAVIIGEPGAFLFALAGVGIAPIYPTVMALLARRYASSADTAITFTVTLMGIASVIGNFAIGAVTDGIKHLFAGGGGMESDGLIAGLSAGYLFIGACALLCSAASVILYAMLKRRNAVL
ncbi:MFS transporter [Paenibacillus arenilitoris]|uniref:MFS transporter n=1 Tax=Paenibacillus arenilitoris TaxID=2772299 RepID=A0A927CRT9_9BACL|nr:MFS transporter [Paenibacillus arenilitoris]MBD2872589.1 MFS transporter [Paenibacillus arenilitoris]